MIAKQMDVRSNIKKYFDIAYGGEVVIVPRKQNKNIVILSEDEYNRLKQINRLETYAAGISTYKNQHFSSQVKDYNIRKLNSIRSFKENWNGNGAPSFPVELTDKVASLLNELYIQPEVFPTALCTIQLEYDNSRRDHMEIEIGTSDIAEIFIVNYNGIESTESIHVNAPEINERVGAFYG